MLAEVVAGNHLGCREPASSDRLPVHRSEFQPAIPRRVAPQQSPLPLHQSPTTVAQSRSGEAIDCAAHSHSKDAVQALAPRLVVVPSRACPPPTGVSSLLCAPGVISTLRRQL